MFIVPSIVFAVSFPIVDCPVILVGQQLWLGNVCLFPGQVVWVGKKEGG